jgi:hypothetical protein
MVFSLDICQTDVSQDGLSDESTEGGGRRLRKQWKECLEQSNGRLILADYGGV